jgi:hypothetical protein
MQLPSVVSDVAYIHGVLGGLISCLGMEFDKAGLADEMNEN